MATGFLPVNVVYPDASGNAYPLLVDLSPHRLVVPAFAKDVAGYWYGKFTVPQDYASAPQIVLRLAASTTSLVSTMAVSSYPTTADGNSYDGTYTTETQQNVSLPGTAYNRKDVTFTLTSTITVGADINLRVDHEGAVGADTNTAETLLYGVFFKYTTT